MSDLLATIAAERGRQFRRMVVLSAVLHVALVVGFMIRPPRLDARSDLPAVVSLVDASSLEPARPEQKPVPPQPEPEPVVQEPEPPPPPKTDEIVIPEDNQKTPTKQKPKPPREPVPKPREPEQVEQVDLEELLAEARENAGAGPAVTSKPTQQVKGPTGPGIVVGPEVIAWQARVRAHVKRSLSLPPGFRGKGLRTEALVTLTASGVVLGFEIERSSGNPWYDEHIERYLTKESSLPPPPDSGDWSLTFDGDL